MFVFVNKTIEKQSDVPLPFNFGLPWAKSLENFSDEELKGMFDFAKLKKTIGMKQMM